MVRIKTARAPWATSALKTVTGKILLPLPSRRDADHAGLEVSRANRCSLKSMSNPGGAFEEAVPTTSSSFVIGPLAQKPYKTLCEKPPGDIKEVSVFMFDMSFVVLPPRPLPGIAPQLCFVFCKTGRAQWLHNLCNHCARPVLLQHWACTMVAQFVQPLCTPRSAATLGVHSGCTNCATIVHA